MIDDKPPPAVIALLNDLADLRSQARARGWGEPMIAMAERVWIKSRLILMERAAGRRPRAEPEMGWNEGRWTTLTTNERTT